MDVKQFHCGYVGIIGPSNVGKSTLLNKLLGLKLSITSPRKQTTLWHLLGINSRDNYQIIYVDTPGLQNTHRGALNRHMLREVVDTLSYIDVLMFIIESLHWNDREENILELIQHLEIPVILIINKIDKVKNKDELLPFIKDISTKRKFSETLLISALNGSGTERIEQTICPLLPVTERIFPDDQITDKSEHFFATEFIREKLIRRLNAELPYKIAVTVEQFEIKNNILHINAVIWVESESQKSIVIGKSGNILKMTGNQARKDMEKMFGKKVFLQTWVRIKTKWTEDSRALEKFGFLSN